jgi:hypothetical protein
MRVASTEPRTLRGFVSNPSSIDPERLAALLEGKLSAREAAAVRDELANADPETIAAYADAVAVATDLGSISTAVAQPGVEGRRFLTRWSLLGVAAAAALAFIAVKIGARGDAPFSATRMIASLPTTVTVPTSEAWPVRRGGGAGDNLVTPLRAARLGASFVDFEMAARMGDTSAVRRAAATITGLADGIPGATALVTSYRLSASGGIASPHSPDAARDSLNEALAKLAGQPWVNAGAAGEALRAASASGDSATIAQVCAGSSDLRRALSVPIAAPDAVNRDSLARSLDERPCRAERIRAFSSAFLSALTR